jgi:hypothetical protein
MTKASLSVALAAILSLAGCGGDAGGSAIGRIAGLIPGLSGMVGGGGDVSGFPPGFSPEELAANPQDYVLMGIPALSAEPGLALRTQDNGANETFESQFGYTAAFRDGILVATRGLPDDLMGASVAPVSAALRRGGGNFTRVHDYLNSLNEIRQETFNCEMVYDGVEQVNLGLREEPGRKYTETCLSDRTQFENAYWLDGQGRIMASRQFISVTVAYLRSNRV